MLTIKCLDYGFCPLVVYQSIANTELIGSVYALIA